MIMLNLGIKLGAPLLSFSIADPSSSSSFFPLFQFLCRCVWRLKYMKEKGSCSTNIPWNWILAKKWTLFHKWYLNPMAGCVKYFVSKFWLKMKDSL